MAAIGFLISMLLFSIAAIMGLAGSIGRNRDVQAYGESILFGTLFLFVACAMLLVG